MCVEVMIDKKCVYTQRDLRNALGGDLVFEYGRYEPHICLCPVDVAASAARHGFRVVRDCGMEIDLERTQESDRG